LFLFCLYVRTANDSGDGGVDGVETHFKKV
jgi:hypothetical protein